MQAIINGEMHEIEPAVKVIIDRVMCENAELKRENKRLEEAYQKATDCVECKKDAEPVKHGHWIERVSDLISKQAVREVLLKKGQSSKRYKLGETWELNWFEIEDALSSIPIMETEPVKHGEWEDVKFSEGVYKEDDDGNDIVLSITSAKCSLCQRYSEMLQQYRPKMPAYCSHCGAKMDGGAENA